MNRSQAFRGKKVCLIHVIIFSFAMIVMNKYLKKSRVEIKGRFLRFDLCNGFGNQIVSFLHAVVIALESERSLVLPLFLLDGTQMNSATRNQSNSPSIELNKVLDINLIQAALEGKVAFVPARYRKTASFVYMDSLYFDAKFLESSNGIKYLAIGCPAFRVSKELVRRHHLVLRQILISIQATNQYSNIGKEFLKSKGITGLFNVLHFRAEDDWIEHCKAWESIKDGIVRDNCLNNTENVGKVLATNGIGTKYPLIVVTDVQHLGNDKAELLLASLKRWGIPEVHIFSGWDGAIRQSVQYPSSREERALISFELALSGNHFIGNSVSTFSALVILIRRAQAKKASYYNYGNIPLEEFLPLYRLSWVTTANDLMDQEYFQMLKTAILSGIHASLKPFVIFQGQKSSVVHRWLERVPVGIIYHNLSIENELLNIVKENREDHMSISHLYGRDDSVIGTWQRIDVPILSELIHENYVLYTDCDVVFRGKLSLVDFSLPLPPFLSMASEGVDVFPYNAGVILFNMLSMRHSHKSFVKWILHYRNGLYYGPEYGPGDQGAYNKFYEKDLKPFKLSQDFNAKPYHTFRPSAKIIHFHGPKIHDYLSYLQDGSCRFGTMCKKGVIKGAVCYYNDLIISYNPSWKSAHVLKKFCGKQDRPSASCPELEEGQDVRDSEGSIYKVENGVLRQYLTMELYNALGTGKVRILTEKETGGLVNCQEGSPIATLGA